ncbi:MAG: DUF1127 domain-containing protein [Pseudolabrys sp.]
MSAIFSATAATRGITGRSCVNGTAATLNRWWAAYVTWRLERAAINTLSSLNDRELKDMGLDRSEIMGAVKGRVARERVFSSYC